MCTYIPKDRMDRGIYDADVILVLGGETSYIIVVLVTSG